MSQSSSLVVPIVLWGKDPPTHSISSIAVKSDLSSLVTGSQDGHIIIWEAKPYISEEDVAKGSNEISYEVNYLNFGR